MKELFVEESFLYAEERISHDHFVVEIRQRLDLLRFFFVHNEGEPEPEFGDFDGACVNVHAIEAVLDRVAFEMVGRALVNIVEVRSESGSERGQSRSSFRPGMHLNQQQGRRLVIVG